MIGVGLLIAIIVAVGVVFNLVHKRSANLAPQTAVSGTGCVTKQLAIGSTGSCVSDVQTMVNYMETAGLIQCPFPGASQIPINGTFDTATQAQVKVVQSWVNCYNKEEGVTKVIVADGTVGPTTWPEICTYAYKFPKLAGQNPSQFYKQAVAAGEDAGC